MNELIAVALFTVLAVISPGADFAMVTRSSYAQGRKAGLAAAIGIALGVQVHVLYTVLGIAVIISQSPVLFMAMKVVGAGYLIYLGYKSLTNTSRICLDGLAQRVAVALVLLGKLGFAGQFGVPLNFARKDAFDHILNDLSTSHIAFSYSMNSNKTVFCRSMPRSVQIKSSSSLYIKPVFTRLSIVFRHFA